MFTYGQTNEERPEKFTSALKSKMFYHRNMHFTFIKKTNTIKASLFYIFRHARTNHLQHI